MFESSLACFPNSDDDDATDDDFVIDCNTESFYGASGTGLTYYAFMRSYVEGTKKKPALALRMGGCAGFLMQPFPWHLDRYASDYSVECIQTQSDFIDCAINEYCLNTVTYSSCPVEYCQYRGNATKA